MSETDWRVPAEMTDADGVGRLVKLAGRRPMPDAAQMARARAAARAEWDRVARRRAWRLSLWRLTAAAIVLVIVAVVAWMRVRQPAAPETGVQMATLAAVKGPVFVTTPHGARRAAAPGAAVRAGDHVETSADGRAALSMAGGLSVRLDRGTATLIDPDGLALERGAMYVDTGTAPARPDLLVRTPLGDVHHEGTQYEVRLDDGALRVSVREGAVTVRQGSSRWTSRAGERLVVGSGKPAAREPIATWGADWSWVVELARPFQLEGADVPSFLNWVTRELGWRWEYDNAETRVQVAPIVLHGSLGDLTPEEALAAVLPTCGLGFRREGDRIEITRSR